MGFKQLTVVHGGAICALLLMVALVSVQCGRGVVSMEKPHPSREMTQNTLLSFQTLGKGNNSAITVPRRVVIRAETDWRRLWLEHIAGLVPSPPLPQVNFRSDMVIAIFRGETEGGFPITITEIEKRSTELVVFFEELSPPPGFPLGVAVIRQPYHVVQVEWLSLPVMFQKRPHP